MEVTPSDLVPRGTGNEKCSVVNAQQTTKDADQFKHDD